MVWRFICAFCRSSMTSYDVNCFLIFHSLLACSFQGLSLAWLWVFSLFSPLFAPSVILLSFLPDHSTIPAVVLFDPCLLGLFWAYCMFFSQMVTMTQYGHWIYTHAILGFLDSLYCLWAPLPNFFLLGHPSPFSNSAFPWAFNNSFRLPWPNYHILHPWGSWAFH